LKKGLSDTMDKQDLRKRLLKKTRDQIDENLSEKEVHIIRAIGLVDDLEEVTNLLKENFDEWTKRSPDERAQKMIDTLKKNQGAIEEERIELIEFIEEDMTSELPSFTHIAGVVIGARLLAEAGSKKKLAFAPSSTMQVLGAEKALFNHIKKKTAPPKHGHIFNHPLLQKLPKTKRGKAARILAGKLSIAARIDYFGKEKDESLLKEVEVKINKL
jgi:nucleolar protein 56